MSVAIHHAPPTQAYVTDAISTAKIYGTIRVNSAFGGSKITASSSSSDVSVLVLATSKRLKQLEKYRRTSGAISILWLSGAIAALASNHHTEPFFALFFSTFALYAVFALKCREAK